MTDEEKNGVLTNNTEMYEIVSSISARSVYGKVNPDTKLNGEVLAKALVDVGGYAEIGPDDLPQSRDFEKVRQVMNIIAFRKDVVKGFGFTFDDIINSHVLSVVQEGDSSIVTIHFFQDKSDRVPQGYRGHTLASVSAVMPKDKAKSLIDMIKDEPDKLEEYFQTAFEGVQDDPENGRHGLRRLKTNKIYFFDPMHVALIPDDLNNNKVRDVHALIKDLNPLEYRKGPYGIGENYKSP